MAAVTSTPPYKLVTNCNAADGGGVGLNNVSAFWEEDWWQMLWVDKTRDDMIEIVSRRSPNNLLRDREVRRHQKVVDATGRLVGYARWLVPSTHTSYWTDAQTPVVSEAESQRYQAIFEQTEMKARGDMDGTDDHIREWKRNRDSTRPFLVLDFLAVHPDHQQCGIASMLVKSGIAQATKDNLDIVLVAMGNKALELYRKNGFELIAEDHQSLQPWGRGAMYDTYEMRWTNPAASQTSVNA